MAAVPQNSPEPLKTRRAGWRGLALMLATVTAPVAVLDQLTKALIRNHLQLYQNIAIIPHWFDITYTLNPGAAFSLLVNAPAWFRANFLILLSVSAIAIITWLILVTPKISLNTVALAMIMGGALGNLIDRLRIGQVVDFILVHYYSHNYPVFNLADSAITVAVAIIILDSLRKPQSNL